jgi:hypothetical protein
MSTIEPPINAPKKRGRKSKKELLAALNLQEQSTNDNSNISLTVVDKAIINNDNDNLNDNDDVNNLNDNNSNTTLMNEKPAPKKRGRKPKGGKIIQQVTTTNVETDVKQNVILHLKCFMKDLSESQNNGQVMPFDKKTDLSYDLLANHENNTFNNNSSYFYINNSSSNISLNNNSNNNNNKNNLFKKYDDNDDNEDNEEYYSEYQNDNKNVSEKLKELSHNLHHNNISDKKSACFWCTCDFDTTPISIPKCCKNGIYEVYGCFCSPECSVAHLMEENIDSSTKFERYHMLNHIYSKPYNYKKNIKPAPNPYYMLDKYYGNLSIQEYRALLQNDRLFLIVDKPLTRVLPELHEDNDEFILNNKVIPSNNYQVKKRLQRKPQNKSNAVNEKFGTLFA